MLSNKQVIFICTWNKYYIIVQQAVISINHCCKVQILLLPFTRTWVHPRFFCEICVAHLFSFLYCPFCFVCLHPVSHVPNVACVSGLSSSCVPCAQCCLCLWFVFILCPMCPMLPVCLYCLFLINVHLKFSLMFIFQITNLLSTNQNKYINMRTDDYQTVYFIFTKLYV